MTSAPAITSSQTRPSVSPLAMLASALAHRGLIWQMAKREVVGRYRGSVLGLLWSFFYPLLMLGVYTFAFSYVLKVGPRPSTPSQPQSPTYMIDFAFYAFSGLILFTFFTEVINRAPSFILSNANYVKKVVFPLEIFPYVYLVASLVHTTISLLVLLAAMLAFYHTLPLTILLAPFILLPLALMTLGIAWFLASLGVYLRDVAHTIGIVSMMLMWLSPVFYTIDLIKNPLVRTAIRLNPLTLPLEGFRWALLGDPAPNPLFAILYVVISILVASAGFFFFQKTKRGFADVL